MMKLFNALANPAGAALGFVGNVVLPLKQKDDNLEDCRKVSDLLKDKNIPPDLMKVYLARLAGNSPSRKTRRFIVVMVMSIWAFFMIVPALWVMAGFEAIPLLETRLEGLHNPVFMVLSFYLGTGNGGVADIIGKVADGFKRKK